MAKLHIGTSGVSIPIPQSQYPEAYQGKSRLAYYSSILNSLEVNSIFYKLPRPATVEKWAAEVPDNFSFTFKLSKLVSHAKNLAFSEADVNNFLEVVNHAGNKATCILIQLPPSTDASNFHELSRLLEIVRHYISIHIAVELRHESWYNAQTYGLLNSHHAALVMHDFKKGRFFEIMDQPFYYYRFHGENSNYRGSYAAGVLQAYASDIKGLLLKGKIVYCYFNNTMGGAFENAKYIDQFVSSNGKI